MPDFKIPAAGVDAPSGVINDDDPQLRNPIIRQGEEQVPQTQQYVGMSPEEKAKRKALLIRAFDRGIVHDRLSVALPPHLHGEWCRNDPLEISRLKTLGFTEDREYATNRSLHNDGTGVAIVGDVIHMICPREVKEIIDEIRLEQFLKVNGKPGDTRAKTKEEREYETNAARDAGGVIPVETTSSTKTGINPADVAAALAEVDRQTQAQTPQR